MASASSTSALTQGGDIYGTTPAAPPGLAGINYTYVLIALAVVALVFVWRKNGR